MDLPTILSHDIIKVSPLFEGDLPAESDKYMLVSEIEKLLNLSEWSRDTEIDTHVIVDFMSKIRQMPLNDMNTKGESVNAMLNSSASVSSKIELIHFCYDSYTELSLKEPCRYRRYDQTKASIEVVGMSAESPIPKQLDKSWSSDRVIQFRALGPA